ncbi:MAG: ABC transporter substrate-binding protein [Caulobacteraceae bacterium]
MYRVDTGRLRALAPDFILTQTQCAVCAVTPADLREALCVWTGAQPTLLSLEPNNLADVWRDIRRVGEALGAPTKADDLIASLRGRLAELRGQSAAAPRRPTIAAIEWLEPLMAGGNWMPELIEIAGGRSLFAEPGQHSPWLDWTTLVAGDPDVILLLPCGFTIAQTSADVGLITERPGWSDLRAAASGRVYIIDVHHSFNRPGPRLVESAEIVAEICILTGSHLGIAGWDGFRSIRRASIGRPRISPTTVGRK